MMYIERILFPRTYEGEGDPPPPPPAAAKPVKMFDQNALNTIVATERRKWEAEKEALTTKIAAAAGNEDALKALSDELEALKTASMTEDEQRQRKAKKAADKTQKEVDDLKTSEALWQKRYKDQLVATAVGTAASEAGAYRASQMQTLLAPATEIVEKDGVFSVKVGYDSINEAKEPVRLSLTPKEVMERMKEDPNTQNLFTSTLKGGIGGSGGSTPGSDKLGAGMTAEEVRQKYIASRKSGKLTPFAEKT